MPGDYRGCGEGEVGCCLQSHVRHLKLRYGNCCRSVGQVEMLTCASDEVPQVGQLRGRNVACAPLPQQNGGCSADYGAQHHAPGRPSPLPTCLQVRRARRKGAMLPHLDSSLLLSTLEASAASWHGTDCTSDTGVKPHPAFELANRFRLRNRLRVVLLSVPPQLGPWLPRSSPDASLGASLASAARTPCSVALAAAGAQLAQLRCAHQWWSAHCGLNLAHWAASPGAHRSPARRATLFEA